MITKFAGGTARVIVPFALATVAALIVLNRWAVTDLGVASYGRVWQLQISYLDFGFIRRGLVGTLLGLSGLNAVFANEYHSALLVHHLGIVALVGLVASFCLVNRIHDLVVIVGVALSPALIIQSAYTTGCLDLFVILLAALNILYVRNQLLFALVLVTGILTHELFLFTIPAQFLAFTIGKGALHGGWKISRLALPVAVALATLALILLWGKINIDRAAFESVMFRKMPHAAHQHPLWSGFYELSATPEQNASGSGNLMLGQLRSYWPYMVPSLLYCLLVSARAALLVETFAVRLAASVATLVCFIATDFYRWISLSADLGLLLTLLLIKEQGKRPDRFLSYAVAAFCLLAPFGAYPIDRPFPMHQLVLERFFGLASNR